MCSTDLPSGLKEWLFTLGFDNQNLSDIQIENEFQKVTPPEMRDIWRHMMTHVLPIQQKRYIQKVLLLHELKKKHTKREGNRCLPKNLKSVVELQSYINHENSLHQLRDCELYIRNKHVKTEELKQNYDKLNEEKRALIDQQEMTQHVLTLLRLKTERYKTLIEELSNTRECLKYVGSNFWTSTDEEEKHQPTEEVMKHLLGKVHEFGVRRHALNKEELILEQEKLQEMIVTSTMDVVPYRLQKEVIRLLENTLSKSVEHFIEKQSQETNNYGEFEWDLTELKKQCVRVYVDNHDLQVKVKTQDKRIQEKVSKLISNLEQHCKDENEKTIVRNWLDIELLKCRMISRHKFLSKKEEIASNETSVWSDTVFTNDVEKKKFFKNVLEMNDQMIGLEKEINMNLRYLSNKSIDLLVNYQQMCKSKIENFVQVEKSSSGDISIKLSDFLKTEIALLRNLKNYPNSRSGNHDGILDTNIVGYTRRKNFSLYLESAYHDFFQRVSHLNYSKVALGDTISKVRSSEEEFQSTLRTLLQEAKNNLQLTEKEMETCSKIMKLWTDFSVDDLIPEHMYIYEKSSPSLEQKQINPQQIAIRNVVVWEFQVELPTSS